MERGLGYVQFVSGFFAFCSFVVSSGVLIMISWHLLGLAFFFHVLRFFPFSVPFCSAILVFRMLIHNHFSWG